MANTLGILAAVALIFGAFVAHKNKGHLETTISQIQDQETKLTRNQRTFDDLQADIDSLNESKESHDAKASVAQGQLDEQLKANQAVKDQIASKKSEADKAKDKADEADKELEQVGAVEDLIPEFKRLRSTVARLDDDISEQSAIVNRLEGTDTATTKRAQDLADKLSDRVGGNSYFKSTKVRSVFRQWGFVTLAGGDNIGVVKKSKLSVLRNGEEIAQLIVTGVEANTAAANIIPDSVKDDVSVSPGDTVVPLK